MTFECSLCNLCCSNVGKVVVDARKSVAKGDKTPLTKASAEFPFGWNEKGVCEKLIDGKCSIYDTRPDICNVEKSFELFGKGMTREEYYSFQGKCCNILIKGAELNDKFLVRENY